MAVVYSHAPEVEAIGKRLIEKHHPHLRAVRIEFLFRSKAQRRRGKIVGGDARKVTGWQALLATPGLQDSDGEEFFLICVAADWWAGAADAQKVALIDHELCHCVTELDDSGAQKLVLRGHEIEEFSEIVERHGLWSSDLTYFVTHLPAEQLRFALDTADQRF